MKQSALAVIFLSSLASGLSAAAPPAQYAPLELDLPKQRAGLFWAKLGEGNARQMIVIGERKIEIFTTQAEGGFGAAPAGELAPDESGMIQIADLDADGREEIVLLHSRGADAFSWDPAAASFKKREPPLLSGMRGAPFLHLVPASFLFDLDNDGDLDLVYPENGKYYLFFQDRGAFAMSNSFAANPVAISLGTEARRLREKIETTVRIPRLDLSDLNGDGRLDIRASTRDSESFYFQDASGKVPEKPAYSLDRKRFKDESSSPTTYGRAEEGSDVSFQSMLEDLNGDKRQDHLIASGNKIWVFLARESGVDFAKPDQILKVSAESMTALALPIDDDAKPDLVIAKYDIPSVGRIVAGLAVGLRFEIELLGYKNAGAGTFSRNPDYRSKVVFKVPPILKVLGEIETLSEQLRGIQRQAVSSARGDFNGDGASDLVRIETDKLQFILGEAGDPAAAASPEETRDPKIFRKLLFEKPQQEVTLGTFVSFLSEIVSSFQSAAAMGRAPAGSIAFAPESAARVSGMVAGDVNGDGIDDFGAFLNPAKDEKPADLDLAREKLILWLSRRN